MLRSEARVGKTVNAYTVKAKAKALVFGTVFYSLIIGLGFAIPSNTAKDVADQIIQNGEVTNTRRAALGVRVTTVVGRDGQPAGVGVAEVIRDEAAARAGIKAGDVITAVDGTPTPTTQELSEVLAEHKPGDQVKVDLTRADGSTTSVTVTLGELKQE